MHARAQLELAPARVQRRVAQRQVPRRLPAALAVGDPRPAHRARGAHRVLAAQAAQARLAEYVPAGSAINMDPENSFLVRFPNSIAGLLCGVRLVEHVQTHRAEMRVLHRLQLRLAGQDQLLLSLPPPLDGLLLLLLPHPCPLLPPLAPEEAELVPAPGGGQAGGGRGRGGGSGVLEFLKFFVDVLFVVLQGGGVPQTEE